MEIIFVALAVMFLIGVLFIFFRKKKEDPDSQKETGEADTITQPPLDSLPEMTLTQLADYNGKKKSKIYLACKGIVFDVTDSEFYQEDGGYGAFASKDCSINLAKMSFDEKDYNQYGSAELTLEERDVLDSWYERYIQKYRAVARIAESKKDN